MDYSSYSNQCKGNYFFLKDSFNVLSSDGKSWGCSGLTGPFKWFGGAAFYDKSAHVIDFSKNAHNQNKNVSSKFNGNFDNFNINRTKNQFFDIYEHYCTPL